jgi:hypothetical protein
VKRSVEGMSVVSCVARRGLHWVCIVRSGVGLLGAGWGHLSNKYV